MIGPCKIVKRLWFCSSICFLLLDTWHVHFEAKSGSASIWFLPTMAVSIGGKYLSCFHNESHWIILPMDLCDIIYFHPSPIPLESVDARRGWAKAFSLCKGSFSEDHQIWAKILACAHVYGQIIWMVGESGFWVIPTLKYQWGCIPPRSLEICWLRKDVSSSHIRNLQI